MNWAKYKQKYFFDGVKDYKEIDKALIFPSNYSQIAELFQKITTNVIMSGDYSDENIDKICRSVYESIKDNHLKCKFSNAWTSFNQTFGIGVKHLGKTEWGDDISSVIGSFDKLTNHQTTTLTAEEYGLAGHHIISTLENLDFPFDMSVEISRILLEDYPIKLPKNMKFIESERKKRSISPEIKVVSFSGAEDTTKPSMASAKADAPGFKNIASLFHSATVEIIDSEDFSDQNIEAICSKKLRSICNSAEKLKFITSFNEFKALLGIKTNKKTRDLGHPTNELLDSENNGLSVNEYVSSGRCITQILTNQGMTFDMAAEISQMLLEKYDTKPVQRR